MAEARILELEEGLTQLEMAKEAAEAAVQGHLVKREMQTERIRKAKAGGPKGRPPFLPASPGHTPTSPSPSP